MPLKYKGESTACLTARAPTFLPVVCTAVGTSLLRSAPAMPGTEYPSPSPPAETPLLPKLSSNAAPPQSQMPEIGSSA